MTPKEKAEELISKFVSISLSQYVDLVDGIRIRLAKECALITVDEIIEHCNYANKWYWQEVKKEIELM